MRWLTYLILAYVALALQVGLGGFVHYRGAGPDLVLLAGIYIALNAPREAALLGCFMLGAMHDLLTQEPLGLYAFAYGLVGMFVVSTQELVYRGHPLTHLSLGLVSGLLVGTVLLIHGWIYPPGAASGDLPAVRLAPVTVFASALYTAILAIPVLGILHRLRRWFAFQSARRRAG